jgi:hypothetical protein
MNSFRDVEYDSSILEYVKDNNLLENIKKKTENNPNMLSKTNINNPIKNNFDCNISSNKIEYSPLTQQHNSLKAHVLQKPTVEDTSRVYNPYPIKNEYEKYAKNGFLFEPLKPQLEISIPTTISKKNSFKLSSQNKNQIDVINKHNNIINANVNFSSEVLSPYKRNDMDMMNVESNKEQLLEGRTFYHDQESKMMLSRIQNQQNDFKTEFQNYNNLKLNSIIKDTDLEIYKYEMNENSQQNKKFSEKNSKYNQSKKNFDKTIAHEPNEKQFFDEYDIANKLESKKNLNHNLELINSINEELKKIKTGYLPDYSNA